MYQAKVNTIIRFLESCLKEEGLNNVSIAVFGSALTNTMGPDSDIDLINISSDFAGKNIQSRGKMTMGPKMKTIRKFVNPMDVLNLTPEEIILWLSEICFPARLLPDMITEQFNFLFLSGCARLR